jgi:hypothetical protein
MTANVLSRICTIEIGEKPTLTFEVQNLHEAQELCRKQWLKDDLSEAIRRPVEIGLRAKR